MTAVRRRDRHEAASIVVRPNDDVFIAVQYLRGLASLMVLLYHVGYDIGFVTEGEHAHWLASGVHIFFVISGFVMVVSTSGRHVEPKDFLIARIARIVPIYWLATAVMIAIIAFRREPMPSLAEIVLSLMFLFYTSPRVNEPSPVLGPGWTLNYEMYFYVIFAGLIRLPVGRRIVAMAIIFTLVAMMRFFVPPDNAFLVQMTSPIPLEFVGGMAIGHYRRTVGRAPLALGFVAIATGLLALALLDPPGPRVTFFGPFAMLIVAGAVICEPVARVRPSGILSQLGASSFSLYLLHPLLLAMLKPITLDRAMATAFGIVFVGASIALGLLAYHRLEVPLTRAARRLLRRMAGPDPQPTGAAGG